MMNIPMTCRLCLCIVLSWCVSSPLMAQPPAAGKKTNAAKSTAKKHAPDRSGKPRKGKASYYGRAFYGKTMADGTPMNPDAPIAASKTLPLGTIAEVTNLENGKREVVEIKDRGPYVDGRIIDLSPKTADKLDITEQGVAMVEVRPLEIPMPDGTVKQTTSPERTALDDSRD